MLLCGWAMTQCGSLAHVVFESGGALLGVGDQSVADVTLEIRWLGVSCVKILAGSPLMDPVLRH